VLANAARAGRLATQIDGDARVGRCRRAHRWGNGIADSRVLGAARRIAKPASLCDALRVLTMGSRQGLRLAGIDRLSDREVLPCGRKGSAVVREVLRTDAAPGSALYAQGVKSGPNIYVSGMVGIDPATGQLAGSTIQEQTRQALANCSAVLKAGAAELGDVVEVGILLTNPADFAGMNEAYADVFGADPPARYVAKLGVVLPNVLVSIRMTAIAAH
jgi:2-iminobutanoate/2-iminopropanoate deaminase